MAGAIARIAVLTAAFALLTACAAKRESIPSRLDLSAAACGSDVPVANAAVLTREKADQPFKATVRIGDGAPCVMDANGARSTFQVFGIPSGNAMMITIVSVPLGETIFSPRLQMRDANGAVLRDVARDMFMFNGNALQVQLRLREGERFVVVLSDPATVGKSVTNIASSTSTTVVPAGPVFIPVTSGGESSSKLTFAHNGEVTVTVGPIPDAARR